MDLSAILIKITGVIFLIWTLLSIFKHFKVKQQSQKNSPQEVQSLSEQVLNNILLYLWLAFMIVLSTGMIVNN